MTQPTDRSAATGVGRVLRVSAEAGNLARIRRFVAETGAGLGADPTAVADLVQAVDESVTNVIVHGYRGRPGIVEVEIGPADGALEVHIRDHAPPFDPTRVPRPDLSGPLERRPLGGMGVTLTRELTDEVRHSMPAGWGNELTLSKNVRPTTHGGR